VRRAELDSVKIGMVLGGKYRVERVIGQGGAGVVVAAVHRVLRQHVAIKFLRNDADAEHKERFLREARAAVRLHGDHIARVIDVGKMKTGAPYLVMEMLHGEDLGKVVERGRVPVEQAVDYVLQACEGLAEAHALGIIHRDVKPRNLFLARRPHGKPLLKILDFGIAKTQAIAPTDAALTVTATVMGSPHYMSPEQMRDSRSVDARSDVWSLGVCLYELLAGTVPFDGPSMPEIFARALTAPPVPLVHLRPDLPAGLWHVVERCLAKSPEERPRDVAELAAALEPFAPESSRGAAERVNTALHAEPPPPVRMSSAPPSPDGDTRTAATFDGVRERASSWRFALIVAAGLAVGVGTMVGVHELSSPSGLHPAAAGTGATVNVGASPAATSSVVDTSDADGGWTEVPVGSAGSAPAPAARPPALPGGKTPGRPPKHDAGASPSQFF
jgi:serine/threonine protein kinase